MKNNLLVFIMMALVVSVSASAADKDYFGEITILLNSESSLEREKKLLALVIDAGHSIVPDLERMILSGDKNAAWARLALSAVGNDKSVDIIQRDYRPVTNVLDPISHERAVYLARAARRNRDDIKFLIDIMLKNILWNGINATLNLTVIRANDAIPALKSAYDMRLNFALRDALGRITADPASETNHSINFDVHISPDGERAFVEVDQSTTEPFGDSGMKIVASIRGYRYILEKKDSSWEIRWVYLFKMT